MIDAIKKYANIDFNEIQTDEEARKIAKERGLEVDKSKDNRRTVL